MVSAREIREFNGGELILEEGERNDCFFVVLTGAVELSQKGKTIRTLEAGDIFGLEAHYLGRPSYVQARAASRSRVATYGHAVITDILYGRPQMAERILVSLLKQLEQTTQVAQEGLEHQGAADVDMRFLEDGEVLMREGDLGNEVYRLVSTEGGLEVIRGGRREGMIAQPNEIFGEISGVLHQRRTATVRSVGRSVVQVYPREQLETLIEENPAFARQLVDHLAARLARVSGLPGAEPA
jgi:CRP-like cAMP-binding protein